MNMNKLLTSTNQNGGNSGASSTTSTAVNNCSSSNSKCECCKCIYCQNSLGTVSVKCSECFNFNLCLKCFSMSAEIGEHRKDHNYILKSTINFPLFGNEKPWSYKEEVLLIQYIEQYGFDNWEEIAKHLPPRTPEECMQHYHSYYIYGNLGKNTFNSNNVKTNQSDPHDTLSLISSSTNNNIKRESASQQATTVLLPPIEMSTEEQRALGYMPLRDDFEREYKNNAETLLSNLTIANNQLSLLNSLISSNKDATTSSITTAAKTASNLANNSLVSQSSYDYDDVIDLDLKLTLIQIYRECLIERQRFKKIARDYGLLNNASALINKLNNNVATNASSVNNLNGLNTSSVTSSAKINLQNGFSLFKKSGRRGRRSDKEKEITELNEKLKKYAQFMTVSEFETFLESLRKQRQICKKIQELNYYRTEMGMSTFKEIEKYNEDKNCSNSRLVKRRKIRKKMSETMIADDSTPKRLTRRQYSTSMFTPINSFASLSLGLTARKNKKRINKKIIDNNGANPADDLDLSNIRNSSNSRSASSESSDSMNNYELVENYQNFEIDDSKNDLISDDQDEDVDVDNNDENTTFDLINQLKTKPNGNEDLFTDEDDEEDEEDEDDEDEQDDDDENNNEEVGEDCSEDLSSGGAASSGGSGINDSNHEILCNNGRRLRQLGNRRSNSINESFNFKQNDTKDLKFFENKSKKLKTNKTISKLKKKRLNQQRNSNGRSERLCSMPGYNLLSENEKKLISSLHLKPTDYIRYKTNLIKNSLVNRQQKKQNMSNSFMSSSVLSNQANSNDMPAQNGLMMLRRHSTTNLNSNDENNLNGNNCSNAILNENSPATALSTNNSNLNSLSNQHNVNTTSNNNSNTTSSTINSSLINSYENNKNLTSLMKSTCPDYYQIPRSTRKRILRFLCDNGWIDIS